MKTLENPLKKFTKSKMIFKEEASEENMEKAVELAEQIDYYYNSISNSYIFSAAGRNNKALSEKIFELGCTNIFVPLNGIDSEIETKFYCRCFIK